MKQTFALFNFVMTATNFQGQAVFTAVWVCFLAFATAFIDQVEPSVVGRSQQVADAVTPANRFILNGAS